MKRVRRGLLCLACVGLLALAAWAADKPGGKPAGGPGDQGGAAAGKGDKGKEAAIRAEVLLQACDADQDGKLTKDELWSALVKFDKDGDGALSLEELRTALIELAKPQPELLFRALDKNGDGFLTQDEVPAEAWARLSKADRNGDGRISADELAAAARGAKPAGPDRAGKGEGAPPAQ